MNEPSLADLRQIAERAIASGFDGEFNARLTPELVLRLLDRIDAAPHFVACTSCGHDRKRDLP